MTTLSNKALEPSELQFLSTLYSGSPICIALEGALSVHFSFIISENHTLDYQYGTEYYNNATIFCVYFLYKGIL